MLERNVNEDILAEKTYNTTEDDKNFQYEFLENSTLYMRFKSFSSANLKYDKQKAEQLEKMLSNKRIENIILDIRGNTGGTDSYLKMILKALETSMKYSINSIIHFFTSQKVTKSKRILAINHTTIMF